MSAIYVTIAEDLPCGPGNPGYEYDGMDTSGAGGNAALTPTRAEQAPAPERSCRNCRHLRWLPDVRTAVCAAPRAGGVIYVRPVAFGEVQRNSYEERAVLADTAARCRNYQEET